ncbi:hypothetical protein JTB14_020450 [Gonioctena quinquepunctata]|nr:hypothetical protein JTB14_020450 [Gonioctena quinquepunctata]
MSIHIVIDSGPRYEVAYPSGISHFLEKLAFNSTKNFPNRDEMISKLEKHGGICDSQASRDTFLYAASAYTSGLNDVIQLLSEAILRPQITPEELDSARQAVHFELETLNMRPEQETILMDMIHGAAYKDNTLGLPRLCPPENLTNIDRDILITYLSNHYTPKRMVVAGVGVEHSRLVEAVQKYFVDVKPIWETESEVCHNKKYVSCDHSIAQYTGGMIQDNTLGLPRLCPPENLTNIYNDILITYLSNHYTPKRMVAAGVGVEYSRLVEDVQKYFVGVKPIWETESEVCHNKKYVRF